MLFVFSLDPVMSSLSLSRLLNALSNCSRFYEMLYSSLLSITARSSVNFSTWLKSEDLLVVSNAFILNLSL